MMKWHKEDLIRIAKRENNSKRTYVLVNPLQGKHIPADPGKALGLFRELAGELKGYAGERLLLIGFAETATAIGAAAAVELGAWYMQTTREAIPGVRFLRFSEDHSHATQQALIRDDMDQVIRQADRIVFIEDEVTTGRTILHIIEALNAAYPGPGAHRYAVASLINGMGTESRKIYQELGIPLHYLIEADTDPAVYIRAAEKIPENGTYVPLDLDAGCMEHVKEIRVGGRSDARRLVEARAYQAACERLCAEVLRQVDLSGSRKLLVVGTEEFMYPALCLGERLQEGGLTVASHATTRSPIAVSKEVGAPLRVRYELRSLYDPGRVTYLYDIGRYDAVLILTDAPGGQREGTASLVNAVRKKNDGPVFLVRWCEV